MDKFDFNDILIKPAITTKISSRKNINPFHKGVLPLITAPMDTVIGSTNEHIFIENYVTPCLPRGEESNNFSTFKSYSLIEFNDKFLNIRFASENKHKHLNILIDIANGHIDGLIKSVETTKKLYKHLTLMVGNVANPETYRLLSDAGADYIRVGIGNGNGCLTTFNTGIGYPMGSLISECYAVSCELKKPAKIVADGGMKTYSDIIKALALGADYVMVGSIFNKSIESCGDNYLFKKIKVSQKLAKILFKYKIPVYKKFRGMSTKEVQKKWGAKELKTSEGVIRFRKVEYSLKKWVKNFEDYLRSAMSYTDSQNLAEFIGKVEILKITDNAYNRFNK